MKVGIFDPYLDTLGGGERYVFTIASCLSRDYQVYIFWDDHLIVKKAQDRFSLDLSSVHVFKNIFSSKHAYLERFFQTRKFDYIFFLSNGSIPLVFSKKLFLHFQFPVEWVNSSNTLTRLKLARTTGVICNSQFTKHYIDKKFGIKSVIIYPPSDIAIRKQESIVNKRNIILTVGRFGKLAEGRNFKKQDIIIQTFKKMVDNGLSDWQLIVVISYKEEDREEIYKLKDMVGKYPIQILENLPSNVLDTKYKSAKIYWHAVGFGEDLKKHPELAEHFGMVTVEAMARGAVPVVFNAGGQREIVEDNKNGFLWNTTGELIKKTNVLMQNGKLWGNMSDEAIKRAKMFGGEERFCRELRALITQEK